MPRLTTPSSNPYAHPSRALRTPYHSRRQERDPQMSPSSNSDKENATPASRQIESTQRVLHDKLSEKSSQFYDPFISKDKQRKTKAKYRTLLKETNGIYH
jgi:hypothetical protein